MLAPDPALGRESLLTPVHTAAADVHGWGGGVSAHVVRLRPVSLEQAVGALAVARRMTPSRRGVIARGMGRAYNDAAQRRGGVVIDMTALKGFELDGEHGTVTAGSGTTLAELLAALVPRGWMVPVVPGTQHVSVGGAIASDIHGKNHASVGTFGAHLQALTLLTAAGEILELEPGDSAFAATLGGMGLTGLVLSARIKLRPLSTALLSVDTDRADDLDQVLGALQASGGAHRVAWLDLLGGKPGRGVVTRAGHLELSDLPAGALPKQGPLDGATVRARARIPRAWPGALLAPTAVRAYNELHFRLAPAQARGRIESIGSHMFPLDVLDAWPRLYGASGFLQYQLVVPYGQEAVLQAVIERLQRNHVPCYLAVLKDFGPEGAGQLSFPLSGWTLALDIPRRAPGHESLLASFDELVAEAGGRVYLAKDARVGANMLAAMYPRLAEWREIRDRLDPERFWCSDLALRTGLVTEGE